MKQKRNVKQLRLVKSMDALNVTIELYMRFKEGLLSFIKTPPWLYHSAKGLKTIKHIPKERSQTAIIFQAIIHFFVL